MNHETLRWDLKKALTNEPIISIRVKAKAPTREALSSRPFDAETLGQWRLIPESYRFYWSCRADCAKLSTSTSPGKVGIEVCDRIKSYLETRQVPNQVCRALERLWFDTALVTRDIERIRQSLVATVTGFCQDEGVSSNHALVELGRIAAELESHYPGQFKTLLKPVIELMVKHTREDIEELFSQYINSINVNDGSCYGGMLLEAMRCQGSIDSAVIDALAVNYDAARMVREKEPFDRSKSIPTVRQYLDLLGNDPPQGALTMNDARHVLEKGLGRYYPGGESKAMHTSVEAIIESLHLIAGAGPFQGEQSELIQSIERFSRIYFDVCRNREPIDMALATFLALSFYDISTPRDHDALCGQIARLSTRFQSQLNDRLRSLAIQELVSPQEVKGIFQRYYEEEFRGYVDDPLCPAFKFPLTANEEVRLTSKLILRFNRLEPLLEEIALKVKYGGISDKIKGKTVYGISRAAEYLLPSMAFLRRPPYPGVLCQYRGGHGIVAVIPETFYQAGRRPNERFRAMQYFYLGHRLEELVEREREIAKQENMRVQKQRQ